MPHAITIDFAKQLVDIPVGEQQVIQNVSVVRVSDVSWRCPVLSEVITDIDATVKEILWRNPVIYQEVILVDPDFFV